MIRMTIAAATITAALVFTHLRASGDASSLLRATAYIGRQALSQDYCSGDYFADDYTGSWVWVPA